MNNKFLLLFSLLLIGEFAFAQKKDSLSQAEKERREQNIQAGNPFKKYGYTPKIATLSKGKYLEWHDLDTIVIIGSVYFNTKTKKIVDFVERDMTNPDAQPLSDIRGRWISPDPLMEEFPDWSPYNYALNSPLRYTDPDGLAPDDIIVRIKKVQEYSNGGYKSVMRNVDVKMTLTVVNLSKSDLSKTMFNKSSGTMSVSEFEGTGQVGFNDNRLVAVDNIDNFDIEYRVVTSLDDIGENDHVMIIANDIKHGEDNVGYGDLPGRVSAVEAGTIKDGSFNEVVKHELGHNMGLEHTKSGLMKAKGSGNTVTTNEKGQIMGRQIGMQNKTGTYKESSRYKTHSKTEAERFKKENINK